jgi:glycosyltransferase involved in cell wall biosynthesis
LPLEPKRITALFLLMEFAPVNTTGNFRSVKFIKYLPQLGVDPVVITFRAEEGAKFFNARIDTSLLHDIPSGVTVHRVHCEDGHQYFSSHWRSFLTIYFSVKDTFARRWSKYLFPKLDEIIRTYRPSILFTSLPPFSSGGMAVQISKRFQLPLIVDMRDLYVRWGTVPFASRVHYWLTLLEERRIFSRATAVIGVTPQLIDIFRSTHPEIEPSKFHFISNGFDLDQVSIPDFSFKPNKERIIIGYVGSFYYKPVDRERIFRPWWKKSGHRMLEYVPVKEDWLYRSPYFFLKTIVKLFSIYPILRNSIQIEFVGHEPVWLREMIKTFDLESCVKMHGFVSHEKALEIQDGFDLILATSEKVEGMEHHSLPSKIFDYIGKSKPILGFVTEGIQKEFILKSGIGIICDPDDIDGSIDTISQLLKKGRMFNVNNDYLDGFRRKNLTGKLAAIFATSTKMDS